MDANVKIPFEAVAVRYVHDARNGAFLNIGVVMLSRPQGFADARFLGSWTRITSAFPGMNVVLLRRVANAFKKRVADVASPQEVIEPISSIKELVLSVMEQDDSSIQFSPPITGVTATPHETLEHLFRVYVGEPAEVDRPQRDDAEVWRQFTQRITRPELVRRLQEHALKTKHFEYTFEHSWKNGKWNVAQPLSLDLVSPQAIRDKATQWSGRIVTLKPSDQDTDVFLLVGMPHREAGTSAIDKAARDALAILRENLATQARVLTEDRADELANKIVTDLLEHTE